MKRKPIFNDEMVTRLLTRYVKNPRHQVKLRDKILFKTMPLVNAAIARQQMYNNKEDLRQECVLKLLQALERYDPRRGAAFAFLWTVICNTCKTQNRRLTTSGLSLSTDEEAKREAELSGRHLLETPENRHVLSSLKADLEEAVKHNGFRPLRRRKKALQQILSAVQTGELFYDRSRVIHKLERLGLDHQEIQNCVDHTLVSVRSRLLRARENIHALTIREVGTSVSEESDS